MTNEGGFDRVLDGLTSARHREELRETAWREPHEGSFDQGDPFRSRSDTQSRPIACRPVEAPALPSCHQIGMVVSYRHTGDVPIDVEHDVAVHIDEVIAKALPCVLIHVDGACVLIAGVARAQLFGARARNHRLHRDAFGFSWNDHDAPSSWKCERTASRARDESVIR